MERATLQGKVVAVEKDFGGYVNYIFKLERESSKDLFITGLVRCVQFPNWDHRLLKLGEEGYIEMALISEGVDQYYDGSKMCVYNQTHIQFIKFISLPSKLCDKTITV